MAYVRIQSYSEYVANLARRHLPGSSHDDSRYTLFETADAILEGATIVETFGVRGVVAGDDTAVWPRASKEDAFACAEMFRNRLPGERIEVVRRIQITLTPEVIDGPGALGFVDPPSI